MLITIHRKWELWRHTGYCIGNAVATLVLWKYPIPVWHIILYGTDDNLFINKQANVVHFQVMAIETRLKLMQCCLMMNPHKPCNTIVDSGCHVDYWAKFWLISKDGKNVNNAVWQKQQLCVDSPSKWSNHITPLCPMGL